MVYKSHRLRLLVVHWAHLLLGGELPANRRSVHPSSGVSLLFSLTEAGNARDMSSQYEAPQ